jgi:protocatechuate 3,4-dioxygenase beta subunit
VFQGLPDTLTSTGRIAPPDEPGEPMRIAGTVYGQNGEPEPGVIVYAYQTNAKGIYPPAEAFRGRAAYRHGELRAWVRSDSLGRYRFDTIRPASYPNNDIPAHVHMHVIEPGCCTYYLTSIHFTDDPLLTPEERVRVRKGRGGSGLVTPKHDADGVWVVARDIHLGEGVPDYAEHRERAAPRPVPVDEEFLVTEPEWFGTGRLVFAGGRWPDLDVYVLDVAGGEARPVFGGDSTEYMPSWSPDGRRIVFASTRSGSHDLYVGPSTGGAAERITVDDACDNTEPRWSPDGEWIAYRSDCDGNREIYRIRPNGSARQRLTHDPAEDGEPSWSADGRRLLFTSSRDGHPEVYVMDADGVGQQRLTHTPEGQSRRAEWSPGGGWISFGTNRDGNEEIYVMRPDGSDLRNVSRHPAREYYSRWSPDGNVVAFTSNRERQRNAIYTMAVDGSEVRRLFPR